MQHKCFFEKIKLTNLTKERKDSNKENQKWGEVTTDTPEIQGIIKNTMKVYMPPNLITQKKWTKS